MSRPLSLARAFVKRGICSRREAIRWITSGRVEVDGRPARNPSRLVDPEAARITVDGRKAELPERFVLVLHKPPGYLTARVDPQGRATVYDLLREVGRWVFPVGRLDRDTAGLLVFTNDSALGHALMDPERHVPKTYHARVRGLPSPAALSLLRTGLVLQGGARTRPARARLLGAARGGTAWLEIVLTEGKRRQVRRMCAAVGHKVLALTRVKIGRFPLGDLPRGEWRRLTPREIAALRRAAGTEPRRHGATEISGRPGD